MPGGKAAARGSAAIQTRRYQRRPAAPGGTAALDRLALGRLPLASSWGMGLAVLLACAALSCCGAQSRFVIAAAGTPSTAIVLSPEATVPEQTAAKELSGYLIQITGGDFPVHSSGSAPPGMPRILVGQSAEARALLGGIDWASLRFDGIVIAFVGADLVLAGDRPRGTLYAVYTFLEDYLGCRWWTADSSYIPHAPSLAVKRLNTTHVPPFMYRETYYYQVNRKNQRFAAKLKLNGSYQDVPPEYGGHYNLIGFVHTFDELLPAAKYLKDHPEWYSLVDGARVGGQSSGQLCLTNAEMKAELVKQALAAIDKDPSAGMISISQNDNISYCQCDRCMAIAREEGSQAGPVIRFVNSVADEIREKHPEFLVETLAYLYTRHAPELVKPRDNVIVRLCSIECNFAEPLDADSNASFYKDLQDWQKIARRLYVWDYVANFWNLTIGHPNWQVFAPNIRLFAANHVVGLFEQGDGFNRDASFGHMKLWVLSHLMWDPALDTRKLMREFAAGYYGAAAPYLVQHLDLASTAIAASGSRLLCSSGSYVDYLDQRDMERSTALFDRAERAVADNPEVLDRVTIERLALDHTWILQTLLDRAGAGAARGMDMKALCEAYIRRAAATGNCYLLENWPMDSEYNKTLRLYADLPLLPGPARAAGFPAAVRGLKPNQWVEFQETKISMYRPGVKSFVVADPTASNGIAVRMPGGELDWAAQLFLDKSRYTPGTRVEVYVSVRAETRAARGLAFTLGIYDDLNAKYIQKRPVMIEDLAGAAYQDYNLGTYILQPGWLVYVAPPGDASRVADVYVDRGFVVKRR